MRRQRNFGSSQTTNGNSNVEDVRMKRYLVKIFEKMQETATGSGGGSLIMHNTTSATSGALGSDSPDPLMEHSNSV